MDNIIAGSSGWVLIKFSACQILEEKNLECNDTVHQLFTDFKNTYDSVGRDVLYNILMGLVRN
jgi:hypothetical protein